MTQWLLISRVAGETRVAVQDHGILDAFYVERDADRGQVGNIYVGRVSRVIPGIQAAFVDVGLPRAAFLYGGDVRWNPRSPPEGLSLPDEEKLEARRPIQEILQEGQQVVVQVAKDPIGNKGVRVTGYLSLPGRFLVLLPEVDHIGVSRRIQSDEERTRLRELIGRERGENEGFIVRTACEGRGPDALREDMEYLSRLWKHIHQRIGDTSRPSMVHEDLELGIRVVRDMLTDEFDRVLVDDPELYQRIKDFAERFLPALASRIQLYEGLEPLFDHHGVEVELDRLLGRKVWLKSGGTIIIDPTEALVSIDVNSGRYVGHDTLEETTLKVNLEAVKEIGHQLQLRDIGGIIVIDFIDMAEPAHRDEVYRALVEELKNDRARTAVLPVSEFGLVELTRKRVREDVVRFLSDSCAYCNGRGYTKSHATLVHEIFNDLRRVALKQPSDWIEVRCHPDVADRLADADREQLLELETRYGFRTHINAMPDVHVERIEVRALPAGEFPQ